MQAADRFKSAMKGKPVDRVPVAPKMWVDYAARVTDTDLKTVIADPLSALRMIARAGKQHGCDAVRQFHFPEKKILEKKGEVFEVDAAGRVLGKIDINGGLTTLLFDDRDYRIEDPATIACLHSWTPGRPRVNSLEDARRIAVPDAGVFDALGWAKRQRTVIEEFSDSMCFVGDLDSATMSFYVTFRGVENAMFDLVSDPELVHAVMEKGVATAIARGKYWLDHGMEVLRLNDSVGNMSLISPAHWKEFVFPHIKTVCDELHSYNRNALIYCHICGNVLPVIDLLAASGLDCIGPLDPLGGFTVAEARRCAGGAVSLMGGVNTLTLLEGTMEQVRQESLACIEQAGPSGGYILSSGCVVPRNCPPENIQAMIDVCRDVNMPQ